MIDRVCQHLEEEGKEKSQQGSIKSTPYRRVLKAFSIVFLILAIVVCTIYSYAWYELAHIIQSNIDKVWAQAQNSAHIKVTGQKPIVKGFPKPPEIEFSGQVYINKLFSPYLETDVEVELPSLIVSGFPVPGLKIYMDAPKGLTYSEPLLNKSLEIEGATALLTLPKTIPQGFDYQSLLNWQVKNDPIIIDAFQAKSHEIILGSEGTLGLDRSLQIDLQLFARIMGARELFNRLQTDGATEKSHLKSAEAFLGLVSHVDEKTGKSYFDIGINIQNQSVMLGPMRIYKLPPLVWPGTPYAHDISQKNISRRMLLP